jgi:hypothetical protein
MTDNAPSPAALNAVASQAATEHGYLLTPYGTEVFRRTDYTHVERVPTWEAAALHHLISRNPVFRGGLVTVVDGEKLRRLREVAASR